MTDKEFLDEGILLVLEMFSVIGNRGSVLDRQVTAWVNEAQNRLNVA